MVLGGVRVMTAMQDGKTWKAINCCGSRTTLVIVVISNSKGPGPTLFIFLL